MPDFDREAFEADGQNWQINFYKCECGEAWSDEWSCGCDDDCPACGAACSPYECEDVSDYYR
jgi:hypothetical protein